MKSNIESKVQISLIKSDTRKKIGLGFNVFNWLPTQQKLIDIKLSDVKYPK